MLNSICIENFNRYLTEVKKASQNTLSSYLRDIRQLADYLDTHTGVSVDSRPMSELEELDLRPFLAGINAGAPVVMVSNKE